MKFKHSVHNQKVIADIYLSFNLFWSLILIILASILAYYYIELWLGLECLIENMGPVLFFHGSHYIFR